MKFSYEKQNEMESTWIVSTKISNYRRKNPTDICHVQIKKGILVSSWKYEEIKWRADWKEM